MTDQTTTTRTTTQTTEETATVTTQTATLPTAADYHAAAEAVLSTSRFVWVVSEDCGWSGNRALFIRHRETGNESYVSTTEAPGDVADLFEDDGEAWTFVCHDGTEDDFSFHDTLELAVKRAARNVARRDV